MPFLSHPNPDLCLSCWSSKSKVPFKHNEFITCFQGEGEFETASGLHGTVIDSDSNKDDAAALCVSKSSEIVSSSSTSFTFLDGMCDLAWIDAGNGSISPSEYYNENYILNVIECHTSSIKWSILHKRRDCKKHMKHSAFIIIVACTVLPLSALAKSDSTSI